ncbi:Protein DENND6B, partial [Grifola frondosa]
TGLVPTPIVVGGRLSFDCVFMATTIVTDDILEADIGLVDLSHAPSSPPTPIDTTLSRRTSLPLGLRSPLKSPSSPNLTDNRTLAPPPRRRVSRSNTLPRTPRLSLHNPSFSLSSMTMEPDTVAKLRRWILSLLTSIWTSAPRSLMYIPSSVFRRGRLKIFRGGFTIRAQSLKTASSTDFRISLNDVIHPRSEAINRSTPFTTRIPPVLMTFHFRDPSSFSTWPSFMSHGGPMLEAACHNIASWYGILVSIVFAKVLSSHEKKPGRTLELGFLGTAFHAEIPHAVDTQQSPSPTHHGLDTNLQILVSVSPSDPPIVSSLEALLSHLWSVWECLVLCEPILVFGRSPTMTSQAVWWLRDILRPIPLAGDFRPFFTIHDADHSTLVNPRPPKAGLLLGVTNPLFERACQHWPHILSLGRNPKVKGKRHSKMDFAPGPVPGWKSTHKRYTSRDHALLKQLEYACHGSDQNKIDASAAMHRHFSSRTSALLVPLQRYLQTLIPSPSESARARASTASSPSHSREMLHPHDKGLRLKPFSDVAFFASLKTYGSPLSFKSAGRQKEFYERWLRTPAFGVWIARQEEVVRSVLLKG